MKLKHIILALTILILSTNLFAQYPVNEDGRSPFVEVVKNIRESVVNITVEYEVDFRRGNSPFDEDILRFFFPDQPRRNQPQSRKSISMGSGFIFKQTKNELFILTNNHVVAEGSDGEITVTLADKAKYKAEIVGLDSATDLAVIKIEIEEHEPITIAPLGVDTELEVGDWAIAIGNPFGQLGLDRTVTVGVISATGRSNLNFGGRGGDSPIYQDYIQTDAAINPGNSGGPLVNLKGEVIGVNAAITSTSGGNVGIGFAIPIDLANKVASDILMEGKVVRGYIGIVPQEIDYDLRKSLDLDKIAGVLVAKVEDDTPAKKAGLKRGDVIVKFGKNEIENVAKFRIAVANSQIGIKIPMEIIRSNKPKILQVKLVERPDTESGVSSKPEVEDKKMLGLRVAGLNSDFAESNKIEAEYGVVITDIESGSPAEKAGLSVGDVIMEVEDNQINNTKDFKQAIKDNSKDVILVYVKTRAGVYRFVPINVK